MILLFTLLPAASVPAAAVLAGAWLDRLDNGRHKLRPSRSHRAVKVKVIADVRGHLPRPGCLQVDSELLADPWDLITQLPAPAPHDTGGFPALRIDAKQETDRLAAKYLTAPEPAP